METEVVPEVETNVVGALETVRLLVESLADDLGGRWVLAGTVGETTL